MKRYLSLALCLVVVATWSSFVWANAGTTARAVARDYSGYQIADPQAAGVLHGGAPAGLSKAAADTVFLYGGPGSLNGKFQTSTLQPSTQNWFLIDLTETPPHWNINTFNAANLSTAAPAYWTGAFAVPATNHAMWAGVPAGTPGFNDAPGYGNNWFDQLDKRWNVSNTADSTSITWDFTDNHDSEPSYDFTILQYDSAGSMKDLLSFDASNKDGGGNFVTPHVAHALVKYHSTDYVGAGHNQVHLRILFDSDGAASDEDGLWPTSGGVQVDNIQVNGTNGVGLNQATFEAGDGGWTGVPADFAGDFSKVFPRVEDIDPCTDNATPQMTFIDDGTPPRNDLLNRTTGGSTSPTWTYGVPGAWVVNYTGGLTLGTLGISNEVWSPELNWDNPGTADDAEGGAFIRFSVWQHLPLANGIFYVWHVRSFPDPGTGSWTSFADRNFVYYGGGSALYLNAQPIVRDLLVGNPSKVQFALGVTDLADAFAFPGNDATPSPTFDNVGMAKYNAVGPGLVTREIDIFNDGFPTSGAVSCTNADDTDLAVRLDMARDIRASAVPANVPGDSIICDFVARKPGSSVVAASIKMQFLLIVNPCFNTERAPGIAAVQAGAGAGTSDMTNIGGNRWRGYVQGQQSFTNGGAPVENRYYFDLPDGPIELASYQTVNEPALFFPGDVMRYYLEASTINPAETATLPADTSGFGSGVWYSRVWQFRGLPTLTCGGTDTSPCTQPSVLVWNDGFDRGNIEELANAFDQNGLAVRTDYDLYKTNGPSSLVGNGLGSAGAHGANAGQLSGYRCLFYDAAQLTSGLICDGTLSSALSDKSLDVQAITGWEGQAGNRAAAYFGDDIGFAERVNQQITFRNNILGLSVVGTDVRSSIGNQTAPKVSPTGTVPGFTQQYVAYGGCLAINVFDNLNPGAATAKKSHQFLGGTFTPSASVYNAKQDTIAAQAYDRINMSFPYGFFYVYDIVPGGNPGGRTARANLVRELLIKFGHSGLINDGEAVATDPIASRKLVVDQNRPNPFNPVTTISFTAPARGQVSVKVYNLRGELVTTLLSGMVDAGPQSVIWNGTDSRGSSVASGIYIYQVDGFDQSVMKKMALVK